MPALGSGFLVAQCHIALGQWMTGHLQDTDALPWGSGQLNCCHPPPQCLVAVGPEFAAIHCRTTLG